MKKTRVLVVDEPAPRAAGAFLARDFAETQFRRTMWAVVHGVSGRREAGGNHSPLTEPSFLGSQKCALIGIVRTD